VSACKRERRFAALGCRDGGQQSELQAVHALIANQNATIAALLAKKTTKTVIRDADQLITRVEEIQEIA
jgi:hypothetical protein